MLASATLQTIICTSRIGEAEQFYGGVLGLPLTERSHGALVYDVGGATLRISPVPSMQPSEHTVIGFGVPDLTPILVTLRSRGVELVRFPRLPHDADGVVHLPDKTRVVWLRDPDGNILSIVQFAAP